MSEFDKNNLEDRVDVMRRDAFVFGIVGLGAINGMHFSPYFDPALILFKPFVQVTFFASSPLIIFYFTSLVVATLCIMIAGVPAAIYERVRGLKRSDAISFGIWFGAVALISLPTIMKLGGR
jgi:hypothetical protein